MSLGWFNPTELPWTCLNHSSWQGTRPVIELDMSLGWFKKKMRRSKDGWNLLKNSHILQKGSNKVHEQRKLSDLSWVIYVMYYYGFNGSIIRYLFFWNGSRINSKTIMYLSGLGHQFFYLMHQLYIFFALVHSWIVGMHSHTSQCTAIVEVHCHASFCTPMIQVHQRTKPIGGHGTVT